MLTKSRMIQLLSMLSLLIGLFVWRTINPNTTEIIETQLNDQLTVIDASLCDFKEPCLFKSIYGAFSLTVDEGKITPEEWFNLTLKSDLDNWEVISAKTVGKTMFMGKIPLSFSAVSGINNQQQSTAKTMLGACTENKMVWRFDILLEIEGQPVNLYYDFEVVRDD